MRKSSSTPPLQSSLNPAHPRLRSLRSLLLRAHRRIRASPSAKTEVTTLPNDTTPSATASRAFRVARPMVLIVDPSAPPIPLWAAVSYSSADDPHSRCPPYQPPEAVGRAQRYLCKRRHHSQASTNASRHHLGSLMPPLARPRFSPAGRAPTVATERPGTAGRRGPRGFRRRGSSRCRACPRSP
jgi:hypothetical protein